MPEEIYLHYELPNPEERTLQKKVPNYQADMPKQLIRFEYALWFLPNGDSVGIKPQDYPAHLPLRGLQNGEKELYDALPNPQLHHNSGSDNYRAGGFVHKFLPI